MKIHFLFITLCLGILTYAQKPKVKDTLKRKNDSIKREKFLAQLGKGVFPTEFLNIDLKYLIKYNQHEGFRLGLGGQTSTALSEKYRLNAYIVYGLLDEEIKYSVGGGFRVNKDTNTWINLSYTDDLIEPGNTTFLTDIHLKDQFKSRMLNVENFHREISRKLSIEHNLTPRLITQTQFSISDIQPTYDYSFQLNGKTFRDYDLSTITLGALWSPFDKFEKKDGKRVKTKEGYPKFTFQYLRSVKGVFNSDFNFDKIDFKTSQKFRFFKESLTDFALRAGMSSGDVPLTHLFHTFPNNITKDVILQRFSIGTKYGFETMYFGEFFSDRFASLQMVHYLKPFKISKRYQPQLAFVSRIAFGTIRNKDRHLGVDFNTLNKGYTESGIEINRLISAVGFSFTYRYGAYHLPRFDDNIAFKFTLKARI